ncbi:MAG: AhpC/TSA family protein [Actinobacteria bacterium]|nr:AhpC/TSA family protein [Actinomycetota bacterium]
MDEVLQRQYEAADERWFRHWLEGPTRTRHERLPTQIGDQAPDVELVDADGRPKRLSDFWTERPLHLFLMRHYGCSCMKERWEQLGKQLAAFQEAGGHTVAVGMGEPERTRRFIEARGIGCAVLCDPDGKAYEAYGIVEGDVPAILHDFAWKPGDEQTGRELMESRRDTDRRLVDNPWLLPAEFVIDRRGVIGHAHRYQYCEDFPPVAVLVGAVRAAGG